VLVAGIKWIRCFLFLIFLPKEFIFTRQLINFPFFFYKFLKKSGIKFNLAELCRRANFAALLIKPVQ
jgi:hypothetical protein